MFYCVFFSQIINLRVFYYVLGNIHPRYRSTSLVIQLIAVGKTMDIKKHGLNSILSKFSTEINKLAEVIVFHFPLLYNVIIIFDFCMFQLFYFEFRNLVTPL